MTRRSENNLAWPVLVVIVALSCLNLGASFQFLTSNIAPFCLGSKSESCRNAFQPLALRKTKHYSDAIRFSAAHRRPTAALKGSANAKDEFEGTAALLIGVQENEVEDFQEIFSQLESPINGASLLRLEDAHLGLPLSDVLKNSETGIAKPKSSDNGSFEDLKDLRALLLVAPIDEDAQEEILAEVDERDLPPILVLFVPRALDRTVANLTRILLAQHDAMWGYNQPLRTRGDCSWDPASARVAMNLEIDGALVHTRVRGIETAAARWDSGRVVVVDDFVGEEERAALLALLTSPEQDIGAPPPESKWERTLSDRPGLPATLGLQEWMVEELAAEEGAVPAILEVQTRLSRLYPDYTLSRLAPTVLGDHISPLVANAPLAGEAFSWHVDAEPDMVPPSPWCDRHGRFVNRQPRKPLFVSALLYLNPTWPEAWDAETMILDPRTETGIFVRPKPGRLLLMDQDVTHRISAPSVLAGTTPRYSLVWKLVLHPRPGTAAFSAPSIARSECETPLRGLPEWVF